MQKRMLLSIFVVVVMLVLLAGDAIAQSLTIKVATGTFDDQGLPEAKTAVCRLTHDADLAFDSSVYSRELSWVALELGSDRYSVCGPRVDGIWWGFIWSGTQEVRSKIPVSLNVLDPNMQRGWLVTLWDRNDGYVLIEQNLHGSERYSFELPAYPAGLNQWRTEGYPFRVAHILPEPSGFIVLLAPTLAILRRVRH